MVEVVGAADLAAGFGGPIFVLVVVGAAFAAEALGDDAGHVGLEGEGDEVHHELEVLLEAVLTLGFEADGLLVEFRAALVEDGVAVVEAFLDVADRVEVLVEALLVDVAERAFHVADAAGGGVEDGAVKLE